MIIESFKLFCHSHNYRYAFLLVFPLVNRVKLKLSSYRNHNRRRSRSLKSPSSLKKDVLLYPIISTLFRENRNLYRTISKNTIDKTKSSNIYWFCNGCISFLSMLPLFVFMHWNNAWIENVDYYIKGIKVHS